MPGGGAAQGACAAQVVARHLEGDGLSPSRLETAFEFHRHLKHAKTSSLPTSQLQGSSTTMACIMTVNCVRIKYLYHQPSLLCRKAWSQFITKCECGQDCGACPTGLPQSLCSPRSPVSGQALSRVPWVCPQLWQLRSRWELGFFAPQVPCSL